MKPFGSIISILIIAIALGLGSCDKSGEPISGLSVTLMWESETESWKNLSDICVSIYNVQGELVCEQRFANTADMSSTMIPLPAADYTLLTTARLNQPITGVTASSMMSDFVSRSDLPTRSDDRAFYAVTKVRVLPKGITTASIGRCKVLSELTFEIDGVPYGMRFNASIVEVVQNLGDESSLHVTMTNSEGDVNECDITVVKLYPFGHYVLQLDYSNINPNSNLASINIEDVADGWAVRGTMSNPTI